MTKAIYRSDCRDKHDRPGEIRTWVLSPQSGVLPLSHHNDGGNDDNDRACKVTQFQFTGIYNSVHFLLQQTTRAPLTCSNANRSCWSRLRASVSCGSPFFSFSRRKTASMPRQVFPNYLQTKFSVYIQVLVCSEIQYSD